MRRDPTRPYPQISRFPGDFASSPFRLRGCWRAIGAQRSCGLIWGPKKLVTGILRSRRHPAHLRKCILFAAAGKRHGVWRGDVFSSLTTMARFRPKLRTIFSPNFVEVDLERGSRNTQISYLRCNYNLGAQKSSAVKKTGARVERTAVKGPGPKKTGTKSTEVKRTGVKTGAKRTGVKRMVATDLHSSVSFVR